MRVVCVGIGRENGVVWHASTGAKREHASRTVYTYCECVLVQLLRSSFSSYRRKKNNWLSTYRSTENSSARNHTFKLQRRGSPLNPFRTAVPIQGQLAWNLSGLSPKRDCGSKGRTRKVLSLWHTHGSAPRSSHLPCQFWLEENLRS